MDVLDYGRMEHVVDPLPRGKTAAHLGGAEGEEGGFDDGQPALLRSFQMLPGTTFARIDDDGGFAKDVVATVPAVETGPIVLSDDKTEFMFGISGTQGLQRVVGVGGTG